MRRPQTLNVLITVVFCLWLGSGVVSAVFLFEREVQAKGVMVNNQCLPPPPGQICAFGNGCPVGCAGPNNSCQSANGNCTLAPTGCSGPAPGGKICVCNPFSC